MQSHFQRLLESLATESGAQLTYSDDKLEVSLVAGGFFLMFSYLDETEQVLLSTCVAEITTQDRKRLFFELLNGQYFFKETAGATLAVDGDEKFVTLQLVRHLSTLTPINFATLVEHFLQAASMWRDRIEEMADGNAQSASDDQQQNESFDPRLMMISV